MILVDHLANPRANDLVGDSEVVFQDYALTLLKVDLKEVGRSTGVSIGHIDIYGILPASVS